jgi:acyl-CoA thioesterase YciA
VNEKNSQDSLSAQDGAPDSLPTGRMPVIRVPARPSEQNEGGSIFGGWIMSQVDIAGSIPALDRARGPIVTRAVDSFEFKKPVFVGDLLSCYAEIISEGRTSMKVKVEVYAERRSHGEPHELHEPQVIKVTEATLTYVAIDENRRPKKLPEN